MDKTQGTQPETSQAGREVSEAERRWEESVLKPALKRAPERSEIFTPLSGVPIERLYTAADLPDFDYDRELGDPGEYPFTRGIHASRRPLQAPV